MNSVQSSSSSTYPQRPSSKINNKKTGNFGEEYACDLLIKKGFELISRNFRTPLGEIDMIVQKGRVLYFVEVKTRLGTKFGLPEEAVTPSKMRKIKNTAMMYLKAHKLTRQPVGVIVISLLLTGQKVVREKMFLITDQ